MAVFNAEGRVFIGKRRPERGGGEHEGARFAWQMPQGGIDPGEAPIDAAYRELYEETNIRSVTLIAEATEWLYYDLPTEFLGRGLKGRFRGQAQKWYALRFTGDAEEINVLAPGGGGHRPEFVEWRWELLANLAELIVPFKRPVYSRVITEFAPIAEGRFGGLEQETPDSQAQAGGGDHQRKRS
jgi:putative (di)nucleoside polyphosphate hydrolase